MTRKITIHCLAIVDTEQTATTTTVSSIYENLSFLAPAATVSIFVII